mmetsp:Transcript_40118/g.66275  ORF Transcript_40118/g.66275 Transcript_40118/m.66275 type:complete len:115 (+) Transcript_40118:31-375(+)
MVEFVTNLVCANDPEIASVMCDFGIGASMPLPTTEPMLTLRWNEIEWSSSCPDLEKSMACFTSALVWAVAFSVKFMPILTSALGLEDGKECLAFSLFAPWLPFASSTWLSEATG